MPRAADPTADPFEERSPLLKRAPLQLLGARVLFESNEPRLLELVEAAYAGLPRHRLAADVPLLRIRLLLGDAPPRRRTPRGAPPPLRMLSGPGLLGGVTDTGDVVVMSPAERSALVLVSPGMLRSAYHTRYELIEFAVYTLAARVQQLIPLHAACVGARGRGALLLGPSGAGKSTVALHCLLGGLDVLSEDSVFVHPDSLLATGVANYLHARGSSLRWLGNAAEAAAIRASPVITRRSGVRKYELDLRSAGGGKPRFRLARSAQEIVACVFLSPAAAVNGALLRALPRREWTARLRADQGYATGQPQWRRFAKSLGRIRGYELRRGSHPAEAVAALAALLAD